MTFDPNEFLKEDKTTSPLDSDSTKSSFNPDEFLKDEPTSLSDDVGDYLIKSANGATFGALPYIQGGVEAVGQAVGIKGASGPITDMSLQEPNGLDLDKAGAAYNSGYKGEQSLQNKIQERSPYLSFAGDLTGGIATGGAIMKAAPAILEPFGAANSMTKMGTMDFVSKLPKAGYAARVTTGIVNSIPSATAIGLAQPTQEPGLYLPERLQNAAVANLLSVPLTAGIESLPAAGRAAKKTGEFAWNVMPEDTKAGIKAGLEGIAPFTKAAKKSYEDINNRLVDFFSNKVIPNERKAYVQNLSKKNQDFEKQLSSLESELNSVNDELDRSKKIWSEQELSQLSESEKKIFATNNVLIQDRKKSISDRMVQIQKDFERNNKLITESLDKEYNILKTQQKESINQDLQNLKDFEPARFDTQTQQTLLNLKEKLGTGYDNFENTLAEKQIRFNVEDSRKSLETKLKDLADNALPTDKPNVEAMVDQTLNELDTFMGDGQIGYDEYKTLLNGISKDPKTGRRIDPALRDIRNKANGLPTQSKYRQIIDEFEQEVRGQQVKHLEDIGEKELASEIKDLNKKYKDYKFYEGKFLNLSEKAGPNGEAIILENPETRRRFLGAGQKGMLDDGITGDNLGGESLINELAASDNPEVKQLANLVHQYYNRYSILGKNQVKETPEMLGIKDLMNKLTRTGSINTARPEDLAEMLPQDKKDLGIKQLLDLYDKYHIEKSQLADYERKLLANPDHLEHPEFQGMLDKITEHRKNFKHNFEDIPEVQAMNEKTAPIQEGLQNDITAIKQKQVEVNNPVPNDFLDKSIQNDKPLEDMQKDIRNLIISGNTDRETGGLGTDVQVLKNLVARIKKYADEYKSAYGVELDKDLRNMVDKLAVAETQLGGNVMISGSKGNVIASPSALAKGINFVLHGLAYLTPNKSVNTIANVAGKGVLGTKALIEKVDKYKVVDSMLKSYNMTVQDLKNADSVKRAAVLNVLMQNPKLRQTVKEMLGEQDEPR